MKLGNIEIVGWTIKPRVKLGINFEFDLDRHTWIHFPFGVIAIGRINRKKEYTEEYTSDQWIERKKIGNVLIAEHIEPWNNKRFFNLGIDGRVIYFGRYHIIW